MYNVPKLKKTLPEHFRPPRKNLLGHHFALTGQFSQIREFWNITYFSMTYKTPQRHKLQNHGIN